MIRYANKPEPPHTAPDKPVQRPRLNSVAVHRLLLNLQARARLTPGDADAQFALSVIGVVERNGVVIDTVPSCLDGRTWILPMLRTEPIISKRFFGNYKK